MTGGAGVTRDADGLAQAAAALDDVGGGESAVLPSTEAWETTNLRLVGQALVRAATLREETRGGHWRADFPRTDDVRWRGRLVTSRRPDGTLECTYEPLEVS
jgi:L-aspartate oxidase